MCTKVVKSIDTTILFRYHVFKTIRSPLIIHSIVSKVPDLQSDNKAAQMKQREINWSSTCGGILYSKEVTWPTSHVVGVLLLRASESPGHARFVSSKLELAMASPELMLVDKENSRSAVWQYFANEADAEGKAKDLQKPICKRCFRAVTTRGGNTTNLAKHLKDLHPDLFKDLKEVMLHYNLISVQLLSLMKNQGLCCCDVILMSSQSFPRVVTLATIVNVKQASFLPQSMANVS